MYTDSEDQEIADAPPLDPPSAPGLADAFLDQLADELALAASNRRQILGDLASGEWATMAGD